MMFDKPNGMLEDVSGDIGYTATTALVDWFGGTNLYVPETAENKQHPICIVIGEKPFEHLVAAYGSQVLKIPLDYRREINRRNRLIGALIVRGVGEKVLAKLTSMTERQIRHIRVELEESKLLPFILHAGVIVNLEQEKDENPENKLGQNPGKTD